jgi:hypothetical protein
MMRAPLEEVRTPESGVPLTRTSLGLESPGSIEITQPPAGSFRQAEFAGTGLVLTSSFCMLSRAQWFREQANLALQRGHETRDPTLRAGFDELVREWLRLAEQAEWIANQQQQPVAERTSRRNKIGR